MSTADSDVNVFATRDRTKCTLCGKPHHEVVRFAVSMGELSFPDICEECFNLLRDAVGHRAMDIKAGKQ